MSLGGRWEVSIGELNGFERSLTHLCGRGGRRPCCALAQGSYDVALWDAVAETYYVSLRWCRWYYSFVELGTHARWHGYGGG